MANPNPPANNRWKKGESGNPAGKTQGMRIVENAIRQAAQAYAPDCLKFLKKIVDGQVDGVAVTDFAARSRAAMYLIDRAVGKPAQAVHVSGQDGGPVQHQHNLDTFLEQLQQIRRRKEETELQPLANGHALNGHAEDA